MNKSPINANENFGPLAGVKVVDPTHAWAGATCTMMLADMGAEVIKIEPLTGEYKPERFKFCYSYLHRNKKSVTLNLRTDKGKEIMHRFCGRCSCLSCGGRNL